MHAWSKQLSTSSAPNFRQIRPFPLYLLSSSRLLAPHLLLLLPTISFSPLIHNSPPFFLVIVHSPNFRIRQFAASGEEFRRTDSIIGFYNFPVGSCIHTYSAYTLTRSGYIIPSVPLLPIFLSQLTLTDLTMHPPHCSLTY